MLILFYRNYLQGRVAHALLGASELDKALPNRDIHIYVGTWNMNGQEPPKELSSLFQPESLDYLPDMVVIGTQESYPEREDWEVSIQMSLGHSFVMLESKTLGTLHLAVYVRRHLIWFCSEPEEAEHSVRAGSAFRTKGAVAIGFTLFGTSFLFVTSHLTAHEERVKERIDDVRRIVKSLDLPKELPCKHRHKDVTQNYDYVFWCGDLNFRVTQPRDDVIEWYKQQTFPLPATMPMPLDCQLSKSLSEGSVFKGGEIHCLHYSSVPSICSSDHKPVWGLYKCSVRPGTDAVPLNAGQFKRDIYLEAIKRRATMYNGEEEDKCSIQ
ncbi:hypothetical protein WDU94_006939 [Cyamophila willieti]